MQKEISDKSFILWFQQTSSYLLQAPELCMKCNSTLPGLVSLNMNPPAARSYTSQVHGSPATEISTHSAPPYKNINHTCLLLLFSSTDLAASEDP